MSTLVECRVEEAASIKWRKGDLIGSGASGHVYRAMNTESGELIAVKEAHTKVLQEEVGLLENLTHPKIVRYLGSEREDETLSILLEYVPGGSIQSLLEKFGSFSLAVIKRYTKQLLQALEYLHKQGIIHGDIKGANILVGSKGRIKLADFGTSRQSAVSGAKPTRGTPYWMAPEVICGTGHDFSADIWSVGCTVIEMATGNPPWNHQFETIATFVYCVGKTKSHPPIPEHLSIAAKDFLHVCLQKEPTARASASELLKHPFLTGREAKPQNLSRSVIMETEVASSVCESHSDETDIMSDEDANFKRIRPERQGELSLSYACIVVATQNFSEKNKIGQGAFGSVYKGKLVSGQEIAVKRLSSTSHQGDQEFNNEWRFIYELQHRNIIRLLGHCVKGAERVLVYEYMENGSLRSRLFGSCNGVLLDWNQRVKIIKGIAQAMVYFQKYSRVRVIHGDIKTDNILLDAQMNPKITDFGLAMSIADDEETVDTDCVRGTWGYVAPDYMSNGIASMKTDVYSYGVVMLEMISGNNIQEAFRSGNRQSLIKHAWQLWKNGAGLKLADGRLDASSVNKEQLLRCIHVALLCTEGNEDNRPTMSEVISMLPNERVSFIQKKKKNERVSLRKPIEPGFPARGWK